MIEFEYFCTECDEEFISKTDIDYRCKCGALFHTDYTEDECHEGYSVATGCLNLIEASYKERIQKVFPTLNCQYIQYLQKYCITENKEFNLIGFGTVIYGGCFETETEAWYKCFNLYKTHLPATLEEFEIIIRNTIKKLTNAIPDEAGQNPYIK